MKNISKAALSLLLLSSVNQSAAFADDKLTAELLRRVEALEKRASLADKLESENKQLRAKLEKNNSAEKGGAKTSSISAAKKATSYPQFADNSSSGSALTSSAYQLPTREKQWQGIYAGINAGYGQNMLGYTGYDTLFNSPNNGVSGFVTTYTSTGLFSGVVAGAQVGYNYQFANNIVLGGELDMDYADVRDTNTNSIGSTPGMKSLFGVTGNYTSYYPNGDTLTGNSQYTRIGMNWIGTLRARLGYSLGNFLPYLTGGLAYGSLSGVISNVYSDATYPYGSYINFENGSNSSVQPGWVLGAGAEYMVADGWSIKGEYLFTQLSGITIQTTGAEAYSGNSNLYTYAVGTNLSTNAFGIHQARVGLNYHTNWLGSSQPVVAKY